MKRIILFVLTALFVLTSCGPGGVVGGQEPDDVAQAAYNAMANYDRAAFESVICAELREQLTALSLVDDSIDIDVSGMRFEVESIEGSKAIVRVTGTIRLDSSFTAPMESPVDSRVDMVQENGVWKVCTPNFGLN